MESAIAVANYFIEKAKAANMPLTPMQLVKLTYIAHGWHLGLTGHPLFSDEVQAWKYGPVIPRVYGEFKKYGAGAVTDFGTEIKFPELDGQYNPSFSFVRPKVQNEHKIALLDRIWDIYGSYDGISLSAMTHQPDTPWDIVYNKLGGKNKSGAPIPNKLIEVHYKQKANAGRAATDQR